MPGTKHVKRRLRNALIRYLKAHPDRIDEIAASLAEEARTRPETIVEGDGKDRVVRTVGGGWTQAQKLIWDRLDGLLTQKIEGEFRLEWRKRLIDDNDEPGAEDDDGG